jgi:hypothetical protein
MFLFLLNRQDFVLFNLFKIVVKLFYHSLHVFLPIFLYFLKIKRAVRFLATSRRYVVALSLTILKRRLRLLIESMTHFFSKKLAYNITLWCNQASVNQATRALVKVLGHNRRPRVWKPINGRVIEPLRSNFFEAAWYLTIFLGKEFDLPEIRGITGVQDLNVIKLSC